MLHKITRWIFLLYAAAALLGLAYGAWVLFAPAGAQPNPEPAINILFAGFPWSLFSIALVSGKEPAAVLFIALGVVPLGLNAFLLWWLQRWLGKRAQ